MYFLLGEKCRSLQAILSIENKTPEANLGLLTRKLQHQWQVCSENNWISCWDVSGTSSKSKIFPCYIPLPQYHVSTYESWCSLKALFWMHLSVGCCSTSLQHSRSFELLRNRSSTKFIYRRSGQGSSILILCKVQDSSQGAKHKNCLTYWLFYI